MSRQLKIFFEAVIIFLLIFSAVFLLMNILNKQQNSWQTIECWNETKIDYEIMHYVDEEWKKSNYGSENGYDCSDILDAYSVQTEIRNCKTVTTQVCKEGRDCNVICVGQYPIGCKETYECQECRNSLTKERIDC